VEEKKSGRRGQKSQGGERLPCTQLRQQLHHQIQQPTPALTPYHYSSLPPQCPSSSAVPPRCPRQRRSLPQRLKSRWSPTCSPGKFSLFSWPPVSRTDTSSLTESCTKKCIPTDYREADLNKGESVCLDRCVSKFFDVNIKVSEKMQGDAANRQGGMGMGM
jgi:hypothetical protein